MGSDGPRTADKWSQGKSDDNSAVMGLHSVHTSLELLQHHLSYQQGQGRMKFDSCMSYFLPCERRWVLMAQELATGKWSQATGFVSGPILSPLGTP